MQNHDELIVAGVEDYLMGNDTYQAKYFRGVLYSNNIIGLDELNGSEGFIDAMWDKIKQFCAWLVGLITGKKETGVATKEIGVKPSQPATKEEIKVTPIIAKEIKPEEKAPKAHVPTPEQKTSDKVKMVVIEKPDEPVDNKEAKQVNLVTKTQNLGYLFNLLRKINLSLVSEVEKITKDYEVIVKLRNSLNEEQEKAFNGFRRLSSDEFKSKFKPILDITKQWEKLPESYNNITIDNINRISSDYITNFCKKLGEIVIAMKLVPSFMIDKDLSKEKLYQYFESHIKKVTDQEEREVLCKTLVRYSRLDFQLWCLFDISDNISAIKEDIDNGEYFIRAPQQ